MYVIPSLDLTLLDTSIQGLQTEFSLCKEVIQIHTLPLTAEIAAHHSLRAFFQIRTWIEGEEINPCEFGWSIVNGKLMPIKTAKQPALNALHAIICCKCKSNSDTRRCTCRKHGLDCNISCGKCHGQGCIDSRQCEEESFLD